MSENTESHISPLLFAELLDRLDAVLVNGIAALQQADDHMACTGVGPDTALWRTCHDAWGELAGARGAILFWRRMTPQAERAERAKRAAQDALARR